MKSIKLSQFAMANIQQMSPAQKRSIEETISKLQDDGIQSRSLKISRLPSKQGYVVKASLDTRMTVIHTGGGHLLVDDVFLSRSPTETNTTSSEEKSIRMRPSGKKTTSNTIA